MDFLEDIWSLLISTTSIQRDISFQPYRKDEALSAISFYQAHNVIWLVFDFEKTIYNM